MTTEGKHYKVDHARIYNLPETPPEVYVSGFGPKATDLAAKIGDGYINVAPDGEMVQRFKEQSGGKPAQGGGQGRLRPDQGGGLGARPPPVAQRRPARRDGRRSCRPPSTSSRPRELVTEEMTRDSVVAGNDPDDHLEQAKSYAEAGYDEVYVANMGPHFKEMIEFYGEKVLPDLR